MVDQDVAEVMNGTISGRLSEEEQRSMSPGLQEAAQLSQLMILEGRGLFLT